MCWWCRKCAGEHSAVHRVRYEDGLGRIVGARGPTETRHRQYRERRRTYRVNFANALSKMKHAGARLLLALAGQQFVTALVFAMAASVEAVRPDRTAPRKMKPARLQRFHLNYKRCR